MLPVPDAAQLAALRPATTVIDVSFPAKLRSLPLLLALAFAILLLILKPTGSVPIAAAICIANLFGIIVPCFGLLYVLVNFIVGPSLDFALYDGAYDDPLVEKKHYWLGFVVVWIL